MNYTTPDFDFEHWAHLANHDPEGFEQRRVDAINELIMELPEEKRHRMRCLQWQVDSVRRLAKTPMAACIEISRMMWDSVQGENGLLEALQGLSKTTRINAPTPFTFQPRSAKILRFPNEHRASREASRDGY